MKYKIVLLTIIKLFFVVPLIGQTLALDEYLELVKQNHPFFKEESFNAKIERKTQDAFLGKADWVISGKPYAQYEKTATTDPFTGKSVMAVGSELKLEKLFLNTGGRLSLGWEYNYLYQRLSDEAKAFQIPPNDFQHRLTASYSFPLLQNLEGSLDRLEHELKEFDIDLAEIKTLENQENFLLSAGNKFMEWTTLNEQLKIANDELKINKRQFAYTKRKYAANLVTRADMLGAKEALETSRETVRFLKGECMALQTYLSVLASSKRPLTSTPRFDLYKQASLPNASSLSEFLTSKSRLLQALFQQKKQLLRINEGYKDLEKPQLYLNLSGAFQKSRSKFSKAILANKPRMGVALSFEFPIGNRTAKANVEKSKLQILQLDEAIRAGQIELEAVASQIIMQMQTMQSVLTLNREQIELAKARTLEEKKLYNQGRGALNFVLLSRKNEQTARFTYAQNAGKYHLLALQLNALTDSLLDGGNR